MKEEFTIGKHETLKSVVILSDDEVRGDYRGEYGSYSIVIETRELCGRSKRRVVRGCHDMGPDLEESK